MTKHKSKHSQSEPVRLVLLGLAGLALCIAMLLQGLDVKLFNPKGYIAQEQHRLILFTVGVMLALGIPTLLFFYFFAWKYRESNEKAAYDPHVRHSKFFVAGLWAIPIVVLLILAPVMWSRTHKLDPRKTIAADARPLTIQVIALRWKWLFIYPEQNIATVNFVQIPTNTPVQFDLTADEAPMNSFWIPHLGGQLYAMTGHNNRLNLMAETPGDYPGQAAEINGEGFAGMKFVARATSPETFDQWVHDTQSAPDSLDPAGYVDLLKPSENNPAAFYRLADANIYDTVLKKYEGSHHHAGQE